MRQKRMTQSKRSAPVQTSAADGAAGFAALARANSLGKGGLRRLLAWQFLRSALRIGSAGAMALLFGALIMGEPVTAAMAAAVAGLVAAAALAGLMADRCQALAETGVSRALRAGLLLAAVFPLLCCGVHTALHCSEARAGLPAGSERRHRQ